MADMSKFKKESIHGEGEQMWALRLFSRDQIRTMKDVRQSLQNDMAIESRRAKSIRLNIKYEKRVLRWTKKRGTKAKKLKEPAFRSLYNSMARRIKLLYEQALHEYPTNIKMWEQYVLFMYRNGNEGEITQAIEQMLNVSANSSNPDVWLKAANWEHQYSPSIDCGIERLGKAQRKFPDSLPIYCANLKQLLDNKAGKDEAFLLTLARALFVDGLKKFDSLDYYMEMLKVVDHYKFTKDLQKQISSESKKFSKTEEFWYSMAMREIIQPIIVCDCGFRVKQEPKKKKQNSVCPTCKENQLQVGITNCIKVGSLTESKKFNQKLMWNYYMDAIFEMVKDTSCLVERRFTTLKETFEKYCIAGFASEEHYFKYIYALREADPNDPDILDACVKGTEKYPYSPRLWTCLMKCHIQRNDFLNVHQVYTDAKFQLQGDITDLRYTYFEFLMVFPDDERLREFNKGVEELSFVTNKSVHELKGRLLKLAHSILGINYVRQIYETFCGKRGVCFEIHDIMAALEAKEIPHSPERERKCLTRLVKLFGDVRVDVWLKIVEFEFIMGHQANIDNLMREATECLKTEELRKEFETRSQKYSNIISISP